MKTRLLSSMLFVWFLSFVSHAQATTKYDVNLDEVKGEILVNACFESAPSSLETGQRKSSQYLKWFKQGSQHINVSGRQARLNPNGSPCISYLVELASMVTDRQAWHQGNEWMVSNRAWLWLPVSERDNQQQAVALNFSFKNKRENQQLSVPWIPTEQGYIAGTTPIWWTSRMAFGDIFRQDIQLDGRTLRLAIVGIDSHSRQLALTKWIAHTASTVANIGGQYPVDNGQALILPIKSSSGPVPWGELQRGGLPAVHLFVNPTLPMEAFYQDWTASHEFSHTLLPKTQYSDRWISEGLATYYQYIVMARSGVLSPDIAWNKMREGLIKGRKASDNHSLRQSRRTKHAYWGGASLFLLADLALRDEGKNLDDVLGKLHRCCVPSNIEWTTSDFMQKLDELSQTNIFTQLLKNEATITPFPTPQSLEQTLYDDLDPRIKAIFIAP